MFALKKLIKKGGYDLIHLHSCFPLAKAALKAGKKSGVPVVITVHTKYRDEFRTRLKSKCLQNFMVRYVLKCIDNCDGIVAVSHGMADTLAEYGSKRCGEVEVIYNATGMQPAADENSVKELKKVLGAEDRLAFMFAGRLAEVKNVQFSLAVLGEVKKRGYNNFKFVIVGDGEYGRTLKKLTADYDLTENVVFTGRISDKKKLSEYYAACDMLLFPSLFDSFGLVVSEAAVNSRPSALIKGSCAAERVENEVSGFVWEYDRDVWADNIIALLNNPSAVRRAGEGAAKYVRLDWSTIASRYSDFYKKQKKRE